MKQGRFVMADDWPVPAYHVPGTDLVQLWRDAVAAYEAGLAAVAGGRIFATGVGDGPADADRLPLALDPPCGFCDYRSLCQADPEAN